jgi:hypothetical protein
VKKKIMTPLMKKLSIENILPTGKDINYEKR